MNCNGFGKGVYAIDQNNTYNYSENKPLAVWNHHDNHYSQAHLGASADQVVPLALYRDGNSKKEKW